MVGLCSDVPVETFQEIIEKFEGQGQSFGSIPMSSDMGIINVDSSDLKKRLLPSPDKRLEACHGAVECCCRVMPWSDAGE